MPKRAGRPTSTKVKGVAITVAVAALFLGLASIISIAAPLHELVLARDDRGSVYAIVTRRLLLVVPVHTASLDGVTGVTTATHTPEAGPRERQRATVVSPEQEGTLTLLGAGQKIAISTSPADVEDTARSVRDFLEGTGSYFRVRLVSNWKFAVLAVAVVALPGVLLLLAAAWDVVTALAARLRTSPSMQT